MATHNNGRFAVLIDADNAQASVVQELLAEVSRYGTATIKRAYGDWTTTNLKGWKDVLHTRVRHQVTQVVDSYRPAFKFATTAGSTGLHMSVS